ncbi:MAG: hypothetical protein EHM55_12305 [Acidobacteria bacterium]|nr:MAG: hypothetical protein EHM55_12305 [Acidobacteriota bacterium]
MLTAATLLVLFGVLVAINPRLRERTQQMAADPQWDSLRGTVVHVVVSNTSLLHGYADHNAYLFTFLVAACVFVVLMLKVIS